MAGLYGCFRRNNNDSVAMASEPPDVMTNQEPVEVTEECSKKKKSKFQTFKKLFARKKRKDGPAPGEEAGLTASQSSDNVNSALEDETLARAENEKGSGPHRSGKSNHRFGVRMRINMSKLSLGSKARSHDSIFVSDSLEPPEALEASQDSLHGKVKSLQLQLKRAIGLGPKKGADDAGTVSEDDGLPCSPPEYSTSHTALAKRNSSVSLEGMDSEDEQLSCEASSRAGSPLVVVPGDFSQPASPFSCLDNSASKHKLGLRLKACNKRKPATRAEIRPAGETEAQANPSRPPGERPEDQDKDSTDTSSNRLLLKQEGEEEEEEEEEEKEETQMKAETEEEEEEEEEAQMKAETGEKEEAKPPQHYKHSQLQEAREGEQEAEQEEEQQLEAEQEEEQQLEAEQKKEQQLEAEQEEEQEEEQEKEQQKGEEGAIQDVVCSPPVPRVRTKLPPSSSPSTSSLETTSASAEPPAGQTECLLNPLGSNDGATESDKLLLEGGEEDEEEEEEAEQEEEEEEEGSFLQEVLSSLRESPLHSSLAGSTSFGLEKLAAEEGEEQGEGEELEQEGEEEEELCDDRVEARMEAGNAMAEDEREEEVEETVRHREPPSAPAGPQAEEEEGPAPLDPAPSCPAVGPVGEEEDERTEEQEDEMMEHSGLQGEQATENTEAEEAAPESPPAGEEEEDEEGNIVQSGEEERPQETEVQQEKSGVRPQELEPDDDISDQVAENEGETDRVEPEETELEKECVERREEEQEEEEEEEEAERQKEGDGVAAADNAMEDEEQAEETAPPASMAVEQEADVGAAADAVLSASSTAQRGHAHPASDPAPAATPGEQNASRHSSGGGGGGGGDETLKEEGDIEEMELSADLTPEGAHAQTHATGGVPASDEADRPDASGEETLVVTATQRDAVRMETEQEPEPASPVPPSRPPSARSQGDAQMESEPEGESAPAVEEAPAAADATSAVPEARTDATLTASPSLRRSREDVSPPDEVTEVTAREEEEQEEKGEEQEEKGEEPAALLGPRATVETRTDGQTAVDQEGPADDTGDAGGPTTDEEDDRERAGGESPRRSSVGLSSVAIETEPRQPPPADSTERGGVQFTIASARHRSLSGGGGGEGERAKESSVTSPGPSSPIPPSPLESGDRPVVAAAAAASRAGRVSVSSAEVTLSPVSPRTPAGPPTKLRSSSTSAPDEGGAPAKGNPESPFGVRLRRTAVAPPRSGEEAGPQSPPSNPEPTAQPMDNKVVASPPISVKPCLIQPISIKPALPKKPEVQSRALEASTGRGASSGPSSSSGSSSSSGPSGPSEPPSWISMARQKSKVYKDTSLDDASSAAKEESERKSSLPSYVSSAASRESSKAPSSTGKVTSTEAAKVVSPMEKDSRKSLSTPLPVPAQTSKAQPPKAQPPKAQPPKAETPRTQTPNAQTTKPQTPPCPITPKPYSPFSSGAPKPLNLPTPFRKPLCPPTPVPAISRVTGPPAPPSKAPLSPPIPVPAAPRVTSPPAPLSKAPLPPPAAPPAVKTSVPQSPAPAAVQRPAAPPAAAAASLPPPTSSKPTAASRAAAAAPGPHPVAPPRGQLAAGASPPPPPGLPQDEPPWMALAKKKAKAWSEMPQIVQ